MNDRNIAIVLMLLFAVFLYVVLRDALQLVESHNDGGLALLTFCGIACAGWIAFLAALALARAPADRSKWHGLTLQGLNWHGSK
jgi:hypothetical protein